MAMTDDQKEAVMESILEPVLLGIKSILDKGSTLVIRTAAFDGSNMPAKLPEAVKFETQIMVVKK